MFRLKGVHLGRGLRGVDLVLPTGACVAVTGANGAGKSSLLAVLAGVLPVEAGSVERCLVVEREVLAHPGLRPALAASFLPEGAPMDRGLRVAELQAIHRGLPDWDPELADRAWTELGVDRARRCSELSMGQRVRLGLWLALSRNTGLWILDDPFLGLDSASRAAALRWIAVRSGQGTVVFSTHDAPAMERLASHIVVLVAGRVAVAEELEAWRVRWRSLRVRGMVPQAVEGLQIRSRRLGLVDAVEELIVEDLDGQGIERLRRAGIHAEVGAMPLSEVLAMTVADVRVQP